MYQASFAGYFPADAPKYSCIVVIKNPKNGRIYGSDVAAPVFGEIANKINAKDILMQKSLAQKPLFNNTLLPLLGNLYANDAQQIYNELGISFHQNTEDEFGTTLLSDQSVKLQSNPIQKNIMPNVVGMDLRDALYVLENAGLNVSFIGKGKVKTQSIIAGSAIRKGINVKLELEI